MATFHEARGATAPVVHVSVDAPVGERLADPTTGALDRIVAHEVAAALEVAIGELPERQRDAVRRYYRGEQPLARIAEDTGVTVSRVSQILTEARERLRKKLAVVVGPEDLDVL